MSSDVITQPTWNRLHVARRVRDIAKSMTKLSRLGRSIFPMTSHRGPGVEEPAVGLKVSEPRKALSELSGVRRPMTARAPVPDAIRASPDQVSAFRLSRHHLVKRAPASELAQVAGDMAGAPGPPVSGAPISFVATSRGPSGGHGGDALWRG